MLFVMFYFCKISVDSSRKRQSMKTAKDKAENGKKNRQSMLPNFEIRKTILITLRLQALANGNIVSSALEFQKEAPNIFFSG